MSNNITGRIPREIIIIVAVLRKYRYLTLKSCGRKFVAVVASLPDFNATLMLKKYLCFRVNKEDFTVMMITVSGENLSLIFFDT